MGLLGSLRANLARAKTRVRAGFSYVSRSLDASAQPKAPTSAEKAAMPADGNVGKIQQAVPDIEPDVITEVRRTQAVETHPNGATVYTVEESVVQTTAARPAVARPATEFRATQPQSATPDALATELKKSTSRAGMRTKMMIVQSFIVVGLATGGLAYFLVSAKLRQDCINQVFETYPMFQNARTLEQQLQQLGDTCVTETSKLCADINGAYTMLEQCDNTLLRNIVGEVLDIAGDGVDWTLGQAGKAGELLGGLFPEWLKVLLIVIGVTVALVLGFFAIRSAQRSRSARAAFGR